MSQGLFKLVQVGVLTDDDGTERSEVIGLPLDVEKNSSPRAHHDNQMDQCHFRGISGPIEHRLSCEEATDRNAVETTHQLAIDIPDLDRVSPAESVKFGIGINELRRDPSAVTVRHGAAFEHAPEVFIDGNPISPTRLPQRPSHPQTVQRDDGPLNR